MIDSTEEKAWGVHLNKTIYSSTCPLYPRWVNRRDEEKWSKMGVVIGMLRLIR